jgi:dihydroorotate dehydrogenase (NAD+) catalytic subunit
MPAAGCFGSGAEYADLVDVGELGAIVVGPVTAGPRRGAAPPRAVLIAGGTLLHTGLANPGIAAVLRDSVRVWTRCPVPIIVHVAGTSPEEVASCCRQLARVEAVAGIELGLADTVDLDDVVAITEAAGATCGRPLIVRLPLTRAEALCELVVEAGVDALTVSAPPRGVAWDEGANRFIDGRLYGPIVLPQALRALRLVAERVSVPLIGCGGIHSAADGSAFLRAGAAAVQVDGALWRDPACLARIALELSPAVR